MKTYSHDYNKPSEVDTNMIEDDDVADGWVKMSYIEKLGLLTLKTYQMNQVTEFTFVVKKRPKREAIVTYYKDGRKRIVLQITQKEMDDLMFGKAKEK